MSKTYSRQEVAQLGSGADGKPSWVILNGDVLDVSAFAGGHPGGEKILLDFAGKDCTEAFYALHRHEVLERRLNRLKIGELKDYDRKSAPASWTALSKVPFAEINMAFSPYWTDSHHRLRMAYRKFLWESGTYEAFDKCEDAGTDIPQDIREKNGRYGVLALCLGKGNVDLLKRVPEPNVWSDAGIKPEEIDQFHIAVMTEERCRMVCPGAEDGLVSGISIGLGPVLHYGPEWMQGDLVTDIVLGKKSICLGITEPQAGSDVNSVLTTARKSADGSYYVLNGTKKWITNSVWADYVSILVRTGEGKQGALSMFLLDLKSEGVTVKKIPTDYAMTAGTGLIILENVKVPARNLLGKEGQGQSITFSNFNLERWGICSLVVGRSRRIIEESFLWANQRVVFGKRLIEQPVIQNKLADMVSQFESVYAMYEKLTHMYNTLPYEQQFVLGGPTGLLKYRATRMQGVIVDHACQILGGRALTRTGMGKSVERFQKSAKMVAVYGGSEEIVASLGIKQVIKQIPKNAKL